MLEYGTPQHPLPEYVIDKDVDLVVAGTRGHGAITTMLFGMQTRLHYNGGGKLEAEQIDGERALRCRS